jgi:LPXTG-motif cell wall-anchored protein
VLGGQAVLNIAQGTIALTATGGPLQSISVDEICFGYPQAPEIVGCVYDYKPDGAIFNPPITLTLSYDSGLLPAGFDESKLVIAFYNTATSKWEVVPGSVVDTVKHTVTVQIGHFTKFAVYASAPAVTPTPVITPTPTVAPTPTPTPAAGGGTNTGVIIGLIIAVIVIGLAGYWFLKKRKATPKGGSTA